MNDIDILEELEEVHIVDGFVISNCLYHEIADTIETLIAENKELKEENKKLTDEYMIQKHLINAEFLDDYIPKSKVEEIIKELDKTDSKISKSLFNDDCGTWTKAIQNLLKRELLEE